MDDFLQLIGSLASLISIPLAFFIYLKTKEARFDKIVKEIIKVLSYQIGDERSLSRFEIKTVINSKLRENRLKNDVISPDEIIEDLVAEVISSPLINQNRKIEIIQNLRDLYFTSRFYNQIDNISNKDKDADIIGKELNELLTKKESIIDQFKDYRFKENKSRVRLSTMFAITAIVMTSLTLIILLIGKDAVNSNYSPFGDYEFLVNIIVGVVTSIISMIAIIIIRRKNIKSKEKTAANRRS